MGDGCTCQNCGVRYRVDVRVPDEIWERIKPKGAGQGAGLLCGVCIVARAEALGEFAVAELRDRRAAERVTGDDERAWEVLEDAADEEVDERELQRRIARAFAAVRADEREACAQKVRHDCGACEGSGHASADAQTGGGK